MVERNPRITEVIAKISISSVSSNPYNLRNISRKNRKQNVIAIPNAQKAIDCLCIYSLQRVLKLFMNYRLNVCEIYC